MKLSATAYGLALSLTLQAFAVATATITALPAAPPSALPAAFSVPPSFQEFKRICTATHTSTITSTVYTTLTRSPGGLDQDHSRTPTRKRDRGHDDDHDSATKGKGDDKSVPLGPTSAIAVGSLPTSGRGPTKLQKMPQGTGSSKPNKGPVLGRPQNGTAQSTSCNAPEDRSKWCYGLDINTDSQVTWPNTGRVCEYDFTITNTTWNYDGEDRVALAVNGQVPGPAVECNWGDHVKVTVHNEMQDNGTSIHWHGIRQLGTNPNDGTTGVTECALAPGSSRVYQWQATAPGSSWWHAHFSVQYADGVRGPIIIHGPASADYDVDMGSVMVDDQ